MYEKLTDDNRGYFAAFHQNILSTGGVDIQHVNVPSSYVAERRIRRNALCKKTVFLGKESAKVVLTYCLSSVCFTATKNAQGVVSNETKCIHTFINIYLFIYSMYSNTINVFRIVDDAPGQYYLTTVINKI